MTKRLSKSEINNKKVKKNLNLFMIALGDFSFFGKLSIK